MNEDQIHRFLYAVRFQCLSYLVKTRSEQPGNLLDKSVGAEEGVVGLGQVLHLLLVLVQLLQVVGGHAGKVLALGLVAVGLVSQDAHTELLAGNILQPEGKYRVKECR